MWRLSILSLALLAGCAGNKAIPVAPRIIEVKVPVTVACIDTMPTKPDLYTVEQLLAMTDAEFIMQFQIDRLKRDIYISELEATLKACQ